jgi:hypothetical protein
MPCLQENIVCEKFVINLCLIVSNYFLSISLFLHVQHLAPRKSAKKMALIIVSNNTFPNNSMSTRQFDKQFKGNNKIKQPRWPEKESKGLHQLQ